MEKIRIKKSVLGIWLLVVGALVGVTYSHSVSVMAAPLPLASTPFVVNSTANTPDASGGSGACDTGGTVVLPDTSVVAECTLRAAIQSANANNNMSERDVINFAIPGTGVHTITPSSDYTLEEPTYINGYSQDGATANTQTWPNPLNGTLTIEINGSNTTGAIIVLGSDNITIQGLVLNNGAGKGISGGVGAGSGIEIFGNYIGTDPTGLMAAHNVYDPLNFSYPTGTDTDITVGGTDPAKRNLLASEYSSITTYNADVTIQGNYIGVGSDGVTTLPPVNIVNTQTIGTSGGVVEIGGTDPGAGNSIENNTAWAAIGIFDSTEASILGNRLTGNASGVQVYGTNPNLRIGDGTTAGRNIISGNNLIDQYSAQSSAIGFFDTSGNMSVKGNYIGVDDDGTTAFANGKDGIEVGGENTGIVIGGTQPGDANIIANNPGSGICIGSNPLTEVAVLGNSIYSNGELGIDLKCDGVTANDALDPDLGPNTLLNTADITSALPDGNGDTDVSYGADLPAGDYRIEFFDNDAPDSSGYGEGKTLIGVDSFTSNGVGSQQLTSTVTGDTFSFVSATITRIEPSSDSGFSVTSEFSNTVTWGSMDNDIEVTKTIVDSDSLAENGTIQYQITYKNVGSDPIDISTFDASGVDPMSTALFNDIAPSELTYTSVSGDVSCNAPEAASGYGTLFDDHSSYNVISCGYDGSSPRLLNENQSINFTLSFERSNANPGNHVFTNYSLVVPPADDPDFDAYNDAVNSGDDIITELGNSINNLDSVTTQKPEADISVSNILNNPEDAAPGATLNYTLSFKNNGPASVDPTQLDGSGGFLLIQFVPAELAPQNLDGSGPYPGTYYLNNIGNSDVMCFWGPHGSAPSLGAITHTSYGVIMCAYIGSDQTIASGDSISVDISYTVDAGATELDFISYSLANSPSNRTNDPDQSDISAAFSSGNDIIDEFTQNYPSVNNFASGYMPADISVSGSVVSSPAIQPNGTLSYDVTLTNHGPAPMNLASMAGLASPLLSFVYPATDAAFVSTSTPDLACFSFGAGSIVGIGQAGEDHPDYQLGSCIYSGSGGLVEVGGSLTIRLNFSLGSNPPSSLVSYFMNASSPYDPDAAVLLSTLLSADHDILDTISNQNYARVAIGDTNSGGNDDGTTSTDGGNSGGALSNTGQNTWAYILTGALLASASAVRIARIRNRRS